MCWGIALPSWHEAACVALAHLSISSTALALATRFAPGLHARLACCHCYLSIMPQTHPGDYSLDNLHDKSTSSYKSALQAFSQLTVSVNGLKLKSCPKVSSSATETALCTCGCFCAAQYPDWPMFAPAAERKCSSKLHSSSSRQGCTRKA